MSALNTYDVTEMSVAQSVIKKKTSRTAIRLLRRFSLDASEAESHLRNRSICVRYGFHRGHAFNSEGKQLSMFIVSIQILINNFDQLVQRV